MTAWLTSVSRNLVKHKSFTFINATGLMLGLGCFTAIFLYVADEFKFDRFHENANRIYRINVTTAYDGVDTRYPTTAAPLRDYITRDVPEIEQAARLFAREATLQVVGEDSVLIAEKKFREPNFYFADPSLLSVFSFQFIAGDKEGALAKPNNIVLSRKMAEKYFGSPQSAMGRMLIFEGTVPMQVTGVYENWPMQSSWVIDVMAHFDNYYAMEVPEVQDFLKRDWLYNPLETFALLRPNSDPAKTAALIQQLNGRYADERVRDHVHYELQPVTEIHLRSDFTHANDRYAIRYVYVFITIGFLILLIACINFINLSTVHSLRRAKEIGIRKVVGASRSNLLWHYLTESLAFTIASGCLSLAGVYYALPLINRVTGKTLQEGDLFGWESLGVIVPVVLITGALAGIYPSVFISGIDPVKALKGLKIRTSGGQFLLRRILVAAQLTVSIVLIAFTLVIQRQIRYMHDKPLGFQKEFMLTIPLFSSNPNAILGGGIGSDLRMRMNAFENEISQNASVEGVSVSSTLPGQGAVFALVTTDSIKESANLFIPMVSVDYDFLETYGMTIVAGRGFKRDAGTDHLEGFVTNEAALSVLGFREPEKAIGQRVSAMGKQGRVIGVIKNYHFQGLQQPLRPLMMEVNVSKFTVFSLRLNGQNMPSSIQAVKDAWNSVFPERVFEYQFLDEQLARGYDTEQRFGNLINTFSVLAMAISALGLFGLSAYVSFQRRKEAGIRKVLGATTWQVFFALSSEFVRMFVVSAVIALPLGFMISASWLGTFANQVSVGWIPMVVSASATFSVILITIAYQTLKTATVNSAQTIRNE